MREKSPLPGASRPPLARTIQAVRRLFHLLAGAADRSHAELGVTASMCAVMEVLHGRGPRTVPQVARERGVSRQHIQVVVNALLAGGLVDGIDNPDHLRSPMLRLSAAGTRTYEAIRQRETRQLADLAKRIPAADLEVTLKTLSALEAGLSRSGAKPARAGLRI